MAKEEIEIEIDKSGKVRARTMGAKGSRCADIADLLARLVGKEEARTLTREFYETEESVSDHAHVRMATDARRRSNR